MDSGLKVTDQQQEISFSDVVSGDNVINVPLFQRAYRWSAQNLKELWDDLEDIIDEKSKSQFLGVLVLVTQARQIGRPVVFDVVDGQQRLSTCYLIILALAYVSAKNGNVAWSTQVVHTYLLLRHFTDNPYNTKLVPAAADRQQFKSIWDSFRALPAVTASDAFKGLEQPSPPAPAGLHNGGMVKQFNRITRKISDVYKTKGHEGIEKILHILVSNLSFVQISLRDPTAAPKIFERLNARGERITTGDLVRNEIFSRVANDPNVAQAIFSNDWQPFEAKFQQYEIDLERFLFPYGLVVKYERSRKGETPADDFEVEHILPQNPGQEWIDLFGEAHKSVVNTWANLIPITRSMNPAIGHSPFANKRASYVDSIFASTREIGQETGGWTPESVGARAKALSTWATKRWPHQRSG